MGPRATRMPELTRDWSTSFCRAGLENVVTRPCRYEVLVLRDSGEASGFYVLMKQLSKRIRGGGLGNDVFANLYYKDMYNVMLYNKKEEERRIVHSIQSPSHHSIPQ